ncbi:hypothetical protein NDN08_006479 [Rhodosorus marinus]|uniref:Telomeric single stranded DNA binding POT1/Cdc13 domain-containing protein n=1 Tax=Rhodosorus marinus TaxID=101924 RepID=A0AAV8UKS6_9RHOD|nr:hypothetical protein NDN08_006479 [Rhodosorus marinus]
MSGELENALTLSTIWEAVDSHGKARHRCGFLGVIMSYRNPYATRGADMKIEINLTDHTVPTHESEKHLIVNQFFDDLERALPLGCVGDILWIKNLTVNMNKGKLSGICSAPGSEVCLFRVFDTDSFEPSLSTRNPKPVVLEPFEQARIGLLREWSKTHLGRFHPHYFREFSLTRPFGELRTFPCTLIKVRALMNSEDSVFAMTVQTWDNDLVFDIVGDSQTVKHMRSLEMSPDPPCVVVLRDILFKGWNTITNMPEACFIADKKERLTSTVVFFPLNNVAATRAQHKARFLKPGLEPSAEVFPIVESVHIPHGNQASEHISRPIRSADVDTIGQEPSRSLREPIHSLQTRAPFCVQVELVDFVYPYSVMEFCRPKCPQCVVYYSRREMSPEENPEDDPQTVEQFFCQLCGTRQMLYDFFMVVRVMDDRSLALSAILAGEDATRLLGMQPTNLYDDFDAAQKLKVKCDELLTSRHNLTCALYALDEEIDSQRVRSFVMRYPTPVLP